MKRWKMAVILVVALLLPIGAMLGILMPNYMWGDKGTLTIAISLDSTSMNTTGTINATIVLTNTGDTKLRLFDGDWPGFNILDSQNRSVRWHGPMYMCKPAPRPDDWQFNSMLRTMNPGDKITAGGSIMNYTNRTRIGWELQANETYHVVGSFSSNEDRSFPAYPMWEGEVISEPRYFTVVQ